MAQATQAVLEATGGRWSIDPAHSNVGFSIRHMMFTTVRGRFEEVRGEIEIDEVDVTRSRVAVEIPVAGIDTRNAQRDAHLRSADFFDAENHPLMTFVSREVAEQGSGSLQVKGDLTIRGVTREVVLTVSEEGRGRDPWGGERAGYSATARIDRRDFGLTWNQALETGGVLVSDQVLIAIDVQLTR